MLDATCGNYLRFIELTQNVRWPNTMRLSLADSRVIDPHHIVRRKLWKVENSRSLGNLIACCVYRMQFPATEEESGLDVALRVRLGIRMDGKNSKCFAVLLG